MNIEPTTQWYERLCLARPNDINLQIALGATPGKGKLYEGEGNESRGPSTMLPELAEQHRSDGRVFTPTEVTVSTLAEVVAAACRSNS